LLFHDDHDSIVLSVTLVELLRCREDLHLSSSIWQQPLHRHERSTTTTSSSKSSSTHNNNNKNRPPTAFFFDGNDGAAPASSLASFFLPNGFDQELDAFEAAAAVVVAAAVAAAAAFFGLLGIGGGASGVFCFCARVDDVVSEL
jgi:hypothetical protein